MGSLELNWESLLRSMRQVPSCFFSRVEDSLKACGMEKTAGANIKHAVMGSIVGMLSETQTTLEEAKKMI